MDKNISVQKKNKKTSLCCCGTKWVTCSCIAQVSSSSTLQASLRNTFLILQLIKKKKKNRIHNFPASHDGTRKYKNPQYEITEMQEAAVREAAAIMPVYQIKIRTKSFSAWAVSYLVGLIWVWWTAGLSNDLPNLAFPFSSLSFLACFTVNSRGRCSLTFSL